MRKLIISIILLIYSFTAYSYNLPNVDFKRFHFGFNLGVNVMDFGISNSLIPQNGKIYQAEVSTMMPGFTVGLIGDLRLNAYFNLRLVPALNLGQRTMTYMNDQDNELFKTTIKTSSITIPLLVKYNSVRIKNVRPYLLAGGGMLIDLAHDKSKPILLNYTDFFVEFGVGCTFYFQYFRFAPEIRFALGLTNNLTPWDDRLASPGDFLDPEYKQYSNALSHLTSRLLTISFNFE